MIEFFYDYASAETLQKNAEKIEKVEKRVQLQNWFSAVAEVEKMLKSSLDLFATYSTPEKIRDIKQSFESKRAAFEKTSSKDNIFEKANDILGEIEKVKDFVEDIKTEMEDLSDSERLENDAKIVNTSLSLLNKTLKLFKTVTPKTEGKIVGKLMVKYKDKMDTSVVEWNVSGSSTPASIDFGALVDVCFDVVDFVGDSWELYNTFSKVQANADAFIQYYDVLQYAIENGAYDYIRDAATDVQAIAMGNSLDFWASYTECLAKDTALLFADTARNLIIGALGKTNPVIDLLNTILEWVAGKLSDTVHYVLVITTLDAITDACKYYVNQQVVIYDVYYEITSNEEMLLHYLVHLVHGRIAMEKEAFDNMEDIFNFSLRAVKQGAENAFIGINNWLSKWSWTSWMGFTEKEKKDAIGDMKKDIKQKVQLCYNVANALSVHVSEKTPFYSEYGNKGSSPSGSGGGGGFR